MLCWPIQSRTREWMPLLWRGIKSKILKSKKSHQYPFLVWHPDNILSYSVMCCVVFMCVSLSHKRLSVYCGHNLSLRPFVSDQDVFLMIRRHKTTIFTDAKESTTVYELKRIVEGILKRSPEEQRLYKVRSGTAEGYWCNATSCDGWLKVVAFEYDERKVYAVISIDRPLLWSSVFRLFHGFCCKLVLTL